MKNELSVKFISNVASLKIKFLPNVKIFHGGWKSKQLKLKFLPLKIGIDYFPNKWTMLNSNSICIEFILTS